MNFALRIPDYYRKEIESLKGEVSMNQFIVNALAEKIASMKTVAYLEERAERGSREHALEILRRVDEREPLEGDTL